MSAEQVARDYLAAFAAGDPDDVAGRVTEDFVNEHRSALGARSVGRDEYRRRLPDFLARFTDLRYDVERVVADGDAVAVAYLMTAVDTGSGRPIEVRGVMLIDVRDGLVARRVDHWDSLGYLRQVE